MTLGELAPARIHDAERLLQAAHATPGAFAFQLALNLRVRPSAWFTLEELDEIVGLVGITLFAPFAHIGLMAVHPRLQRRGFGRRLVEHALAWAEQQGAATVTLYSTDAGLPLYRGLGFVQRAEAREYAAYGHYHALPALPPAPPPAHDIALDRTLSGGDRHALFDALLTDPAIERLASDDGYLYLRNGYCGPFGARNPAAAAPLLAAALGARPGEEVRVILPSATHAAEGLLASHGFECRRVSAYLERGPAFPHRRDGLFGLTSYSLG